MFLLKSVGDDSQDIILLYELVVYLVDGHIGADELADHDLLAHLHGHLYVLGAGANGNNLIDCGLFLIGGSQDDTGDSGLLCLVLLQQNIVCHRLQFHLIFLHTLCI